MKLKDIEERYNRSIEVMNAAADEVDAATEETTPEELAALSGAASDAADDVERCHTLLTEARTIERARAQHTPIAHSDASPVIVVNEPDMYQRGGRSFMRDLYAAKIKGDQGALQRIQRHHDYEFEKRFAHAGVEERAVATATLGGIIPPQYLIDLYAKAPRNGRVYADQANRDDLPDAGMSVVIPRVVTGSAAGPQTAENAVVVTQDPTEIDLSVPVRTISGFLPVSRQTLERSGYSDKILFEDLAARYNASVDSGCLSGSGAAGQVLGVLNTAGVSSSVASAATVAGVWSKIADVIQQIASAVGGLGYVPDKIIMHPRRYGFFTAALDGQGRPLLVPGPALLSTEGMNVMAAGGDVSVYGYTGTLIHGLPVYTDANIPTNLGAGTNEDRIIVQCSQVVHLFERSGDPITLSFEQQAGTNLQVQLVAYGYIAYTAGRYPVASGVVSGTGLVPPAF